MKTFINASVATACVLLLLLCESGKAQVPNTVAVGFANVSHTAVIVKGYTIVNAQKRPGQLVPIKKNSKGYEDTVPIGIRYYSVYDANTNRILLMDHPVPIQNNTFLSIMTSPLDPMKVIIK